MKGVEDFLREYFRARTDLHREFARLHGPVADRFFSADHRSYRPEWSIQHSEAERILSVSPLENGAEVVTSGCLGDRFRMRYRLCATLDSWRIESIEMECDICHGTGKRKDGESDCRLCKGKGWSLLGEKGAS